MIKIEEIHDLLKSIRLKYSYDFTEYAESSVIRRITHFMETNKIDTIKDLEKEILSNESAFALFSQKFTVNVTEMFRDPSFFMSLRKNIIRRLATYPFIKIWVAGCSTGEEVYSLAILLKEEGLLERSVIYATDINPKVVRAAKEGIFPIQQLQLYTKNYQTSGGKHSLSDYYMAKYDSVLFHKALRKDIVFSVHNLAVDKSFNEFQLILCRNVLIYFNQNLQNKVINLFHDSLCPFGYLALGNKESLLFTDRKLDYHEVDRKEKIFIRNN